MGEEGSDELIEARLDVPKVPCLVHSTAVDQSLGPRNDRPFFFFWRHETPDSPSRSTSDYQYARELQVLAASKKIVITCTVQNQVVFDLPPPGKENESRPDS